MMVLVIAGAVVAGGFAWRVVDVAGGKVSAAAVVAVNGGEPMLCEALVLPVIVIAGTIIVVAGGRLNAGVVIAGTAVAGGFAWRVVVLSGSMMDLYRMSGSMMDL